jgi:hypothetical protein
MSLEIVPIAAHHRSRWEYLTAENAQLKFVNGAHSVFTVPAALDSALLQRSVDFLTSRHPVLAARVKVLESGPAFVIDKDFSVKVESMSVGVGAVAPAQRRAVAREMASQAVWRRYRLSEEPGLRIFMIELDARECLVGVVIHHFIADAFSVGIAVAELMIAYASFEQGRSPPLPALAYQYFDYVRSVNERAANGMAAHEAYWRETMAGAPPTLLPADASLKPDDKGDEASYSFDLPGPVIQVLSRAAQHNVFALLWTVLGALAASLTRLTGSTDIVIQTVLAGRDDPRLQTMIGPFFDSMAVRMALPQTATFADTIERARQAFIRGLAHRDYSFSLVKPWLPQVGASAVSPTLNFINGHPGRARVNSLKTFEIEAPPADLLPAGGHPSFYMMIKRGTADGMQARIEYFGPRYKKETIERFASTFCRALAQISADPDHKVASLAID